MLSFREATIDDLPTLVEMLADDTLGATREDASQPLKPAYIDAFNAIKTDPNNRLILAIKNDSIVGMMQLTFIPYLTYQGAWRCLIEGVRINSNFRGDGYGTAMIEYAIQQAKEHHCLLVQLTSDKQRPEAIKFYEKLGFLASHEGFKYLLKR